MDTSCTSPSNICRMHCSAACRILPDLQDHPRTLPTRREDQAPANDNTDCAMRSHDTSVHMTPIGKTRFQHEDPNSASRDALSGHQRRQRANPSKGPTPTIKARQASQPTKQASHRQASQAIPASQPGQPSQPIQPTKPTKPSKPASRAN